MQQVWVVELHNIKEKTFENSKPQETKQTKIFGLQMPFLDRFNRFTHFTTTWILNMSFVNKCSDFLVCCCVWPMCGSIVPVPVNIVLPLESERLARVWTTKKWGRSPGWNLLSISSMMSLMCLLPTATNILLAACCQSGMTSWLNHKDGEKTVRKITYHQPSTG